METTTLESKTLAQILKSFREAEECDLALDEHSKEELAEKVDAYHAVISKFEALKTDYLTQIEALDTKVDKIDLKIERIKEHLVYLMQSFGWESLQGKAVKLSLRASESIEVSKDLDFSNSLMAPYRREKLSYSWDKSALKEALKEGKTFGNRVFIKKTVRPHFK